MSQTIHVAKALIVDAEDNCLILRRSGTHPHAAHKPDLPGGQLDDNESPTEAVVREIQEETGLDVLPAQVQLLFATTEWEQERDRNLVRLLYVAHLPAVKPEVHISWEHEEATWTPIDKVLDVLEHPEYSKGLRHIFAHKLQDF